MSMLAVCPTEPYFSGFQCAGCTALARPLSWGGLDVVHNASCSRSFSHEADFVARFQHVETIRFGEVVGLTTSAPRTDADLRQYSDADMHALRRGQLKRQYGCDAVSVLPSKR